MASFTHGRKQGFGEGALLCVLCSLSPLTGTSTLACVVARLRVIAGKKGTAILTFTNNLNEEQIKVYVYVQ